MPQRIKVRGRFATAYDIAETLGVSLSRTRELIETARKMTQGGTARRANAGGRFSAAKKTNTGSPATAVRTKSGRHAEATKKKAPARIAKAHR